MAICSFRADNYDFESLLLGGELRVVVSLLERARQGLALCEAGGEAETRILESFSRSGLVALRARTAVLEPAGLEFLDACRRLAGRDRAGS